MEQGTEIRRKREIRRTLAPMPTRFKPVSRANKFDAADWTERAVDFGLDALTKKQQSALIVYNNDLKRMFEASDFAFFARQSTRLGVEINRYVMPKLLKKVRVDHSSLEIGYKQS